ncbi:hypothetical protein OG749_04940 [Streptomyces nojiriensis]
MKPLTGTTTTDQAPADPAATDVAALKVLRRMVANVEAAETQAP